MSEKGRILVENLEERRIILTPEGNDIAINGSALTDHDRDQLRTNKQEVIGYLRSRAGLCPVCGRGAQTSPPPATQVNDLKALKAGQSEYFQWPEEAYQRLEELMQPGDEIVERYALSVIVRRPDGTRYEVTKNGLRK